jgi:transcriptional regulator
VYVPAHFKPDDSAVHELLVRMGAADLITMTARGLMATMLPLLYDETGPDGADRLLGHVARNNDQWREPVQGDALVIVRGPDGYVSPAWYATKREHGRVVPTWNYVTAHVYGDLVIHDDPAWVEALVRRLTDRHEGGRPEPWSVDDAPAPYIVGQLRAIVGIEVRITRIEGKFKLSQNRSEADVEGVIAGLAASGRNELADVMRQEVRRSER